MPKTLHLHWHDHTVDISGAWQLTVEVLAAAAFVAIVLALASLVGTDPDMTFWMPGVDIMGNATGIPLPR